VGVSITAVGVIVLALDTKRCLMQLRNSERRHHHTWGFFGGKVEPTEAPIDAICRELTEEIGFVPDISKLNPLDVYESADKNFYYLTFVAVVDQEFSPQLNHESAGYAWVDIGAWPRPLHAGSKATLMQNHGTEKLWKILEINQPT
jgi:8-oxo-dGTP pyrophosphatase MutT (NUDIX family)